MQLSRSSMVLQFNSSYQHKILDTFHNSYHLHCNAIHRDSLPLTTIPMTQSWLQSCAIEKEKQEEKDRENFLNWPNMLKPLAMQQYRMLIYRYFQPSDVEAQIFALPLRRMLALLSPNLTNRRVRRTRLLRCGSSSINFNDICIDILFGRHSALGSSTEHHPESVSSRTRDGKRAEFGITRCRVPILAAHTRGESAP